MKLSRRKKAKAFERLYFENYELFCRGIFHFVGDTEIVKDIVQDVFLKYWRKINELEIRESPKGYLYKSCVNQALNYLKEKERRENRELHFTSEISKPGANSERPDRIYQVLETQLNIERAIDQLPASCKSAFLLSRYEQKSYKEIANILNISINTVEKHIGKALKKLRKSLEHG